MLQSKLPNEDVTITNVTMDRGVLVLSGPRSREVLAKHDENYMPPEVAEALEASGYDHKGKAL